MKNRPSNWNGLEPWGFFGGFWAREMERKGEGVSSPPAKLVPPIPPRKVPFYFKDSTSGLWHITGRTRQADFIRLSCKFAGAWTTYLAIFCREREQSADETPDMHLFVDKSAIPFPYLQEKYRKQWPLRGLIPASSPSGLSDWLRQSMEDYPAGTYRAFRDLDIPLIEEKE